MVSLLAPAAIAITFGSRMFSSTNLTTETPQRSPENGVGPNGPDEGTARTNDDDTAKPARNGGELLAPSQNGHQSNSVLVEETSGDVVDDRVQTEPEPSPKRGVEDHGTIGADDPPLSRDRADSNLTPQAIDESPRDEAAATTIAEDAPDGGEFPSSSDHREAIEATMDGEDDDSDDDGAEAAPTVAALAVTRKDRGAERLRLRQKTAAEAAVNNLEDGTVPIAPFIRYVNTLSRELAEANLLVGQLSAERDMLARQVQQTEGLPATDLVGPRSAKVAKKEAKIATRQEVRLDRQETRTEAKSTKQIDGTEIDPELVDRAMRMGRRRRYIAVGVIALLGAGFVLAGQMDYDLGSKMSRGGLGTIQYVGPFIQIFLAIWIIYRIGRVGSKGVRWLFPTEEMVYHKKKRRERFLQNASVPAAGGASTGAAPVALGNVMAPSVDGRQEQTEHSPGDQADNR